MLVPPLSCNDFRAFSIDMYYVFTNRCCFDHTECLLTGSDPRCLISDLSCNTNTRIISKEIITLYTSGQSSRDKKHKVLTRKRIYTVYVMKKICFPNSFSSSDLNIALPVCSMYVVFKYYSNT